MNKRRAIPLIFVVDFLAALVLTLFALITLATFTPKAKPPTIQTLGAYAIIMTWPDASNDDVDLYAQNPHGDICFFEALTIGGMTLEGDDLGLQQYKTLFEGKLRNVERLIVRTTMPGEYVINAQMYQKRDIGSTPVTITLWKIAGADQQLASQTVILSANGDERTAFRFTLNNQGIFTSINHLQKKLVDVARYGRG